jgi:hypothetical protein
VSTRLVATLKAELSAQSLLVNEAQGLQAQVESRDSRIDELGRHIMDLTNSLASARTEVKNLSAKLTVSKSAEAVAVRLPGSAIKSGKSGLSSHRGIASNEILHKAQLKEDLYAELTGLIVRDVKANECGGAGTEVIYDCIQTGRNGSKSSRLLSHKLKDSPTACCIVNSQLDILMHFPVL